MGNKERIHVYSEIGKLKKVMLHRPGKEIENLVPDYLERLLFDDIPYLEVARREHDYFAEVLRSNGAEVLYLESLVATAITEGNLKEAFVAEMISEVDIESEGIKRELSRYLLDMPDKEMVDKIMAGVRKSEIGVKEDYNDYPFIIDPMPNLYFTRDPFACIGSGVTLNSMKTKTRRRETIFGKYIFSHHPSYKDSGVGLWYDRTEPYSIEGGDELVLSKEVLAIGFSQRTDKEAILKVAENIFKQNVGFKTVLIFEIPKTRAFMHLDTVFTMIDHDKFTVHPGIEATLRVTAVSYDLAKEELVLKEEIGTLEQILSKYLDRHISLIRCGGGDKIISQREQWNDGSNTLAIAPGRVITYERNYVTNEILDKHNVSVITIPSSELSRGRGGPRCMSMPFIREDLD
ncbi:arginine deiminase [Clostridium collagenovorans DSM 3089]|uniref:Arginine deiminase n=1 Tax=Clostridium collagenovorans DSM 3089 TaxID=1121306 RepID=A0A1M5WKM2_9CLOT|nr:arginine deiminase [Clostridium collagenovorans]SHH88096.1 arginine deiminase [Clostridium collagenovorans DSM 3089]